MNKKILFLFLLVFMIVPFITAAPPVTQVQEFPEGYLIEESQHGYLKLNEDYQYNFFVFNASNGILITNESVNCTFFLANSSGNVLMMKPAEYYDMYWSVDLLGGNFSESGAHPYGVICQGDYGGALAGIFEVTPTAEPKDNVQLYSRIFMILLSIILVVLIQTNSRKVNYDRWYENLAKKYEKKNWVKFGLSALGYNLMKNSWIFSYLVGLLGLLILTELTFFFNITSALEIMKIVLGLYSWSAIVVSLIFFSQVQEWIVGWLDDLQNLNWGIDKQ